MFERIRQRDQREKQFFVDDAAEGFSLLSECRLLSEPRPADSQEFLRRLLADENLIGQVALRLLKGPKTSVQVRETRRVGDNFPLRF